MADVRDFDDDKFREANLDWWRRVTPPGHGLTGFYFRRTASFFKLNGPGSIHMVYLVGQMLHDLMDQVEKK